MSLKCSLCFECVDGYISCRVAIHVESECVEWIKIESDSRFYYLSTLDTTAAVLVRCNFSLFDRLVLIFVHLSTLLVEMQRL